MTADPAATTAHNLVEQWLEGESGDHEIDDSGTEFRDFFNIVPEIREDLERRIQQFILTHDPR